MAVAAALFYQIEEFKLQREESIADQERRKEEREEVEAFHNRKEQFEKTNRTLELLTPLFDRSSRSGIIIRDSLKENNFDLRKVKIFVGPDGSMETEKAIRYTDITLSVCRNIKLLLERNLIEHSLCVSSLRNDYEEWLSDFISKVSENPELQKRWFGNPFKNNELQELKLFLDSLFKA